MHETWWLGPAASVFASLSYALLRDSSTGEKRWPHRASVGSVLLTLIAITFVALAWSKVARPSSRVPHPTEIGQVS